MKLKPQATLHPGVREIGRAAWDGCLASPAYAANPFVSSDFLSTLEESGCVGGRTGWRPCPLSVEDEAGRVAAVMPLYVKTHSQGEYVFDHSWAQAYERAGGDYYPKLQCAAPFSPVTGPRLLLREDVDAAQGLGVLTTAAVSACRQLKCSSLHVTFPLESEWRAMGEEGLLQRQDRQYHWANDGYRDFDDFLSRLSSSRRKTIRRERRDAVQGLEIEALTGGDLTEAAWDAFFAFYQDTGSRKWGRPYLNRRFFSLIGEGMADRVLLLMAKRDGRYVAGALNLLGADCLYGRNWGALEDIPFLHFELCYYQAIEHAIRLGLKRVEAGAQGEHKIARGYLPAPVYSAHWIADPALRQPVARYLEQERAAVEQEMAAMAAEYSPFREGD